MEERLVEARETGKLNLRQAARRRWRLRCCRLPPPPCASSSSIENQQSNCMPPTIKLHSYLEGGSHALDGAIEAAQAAGIRVVELDISSCGLDALPAALPRLAPTLRMLRLKYNPGITSLDVGALCRLPRLELLDADGCGIATLPHQAALPRLSTLRHLSLASNGLASLPDNIASLPALAVLCISNNPLTALPDALGACPALELLDVSGCRLAGDSLPPSLALCRTLQRLFCQVGWEAHT